MLTAMQPTPSMHLCIRIGNRGAQAQPQCMLARGCVRGRGIRRWGWVKLSRWAGLRLLVLTLSGMIDSSDALLLFG